jgi:AcrR family transcriptional regulator
MSSKSGEHDFARGRHRRALLDAAKALLQTKGYGNITARDLVAASNTNLASIGYHFGSKEALLTEAIGEALEEWAERLAAATTVDPDGASPARLVEIWRAVLDDFDDIRPYFAAFIEALPRSRRSVELADRLAQHYDRQRERVAAMLATACAGLEKREARLLATLAIAVTDGLMLQSFVDRGEMPIAAHLLEAFAQRRQA